MINTKVFAIVVILVIGVVTVGLYSLPAGGQVLEAPSLITERACWLLRSMTLAWG